MTAGLAFDRGRRGSCLILALIAAGTFQVVRQSSDIEFWGRAADTAATITVFVAVLLTSFERAAWPSAARFRPGVYFDRFSRAAVDSGISPPPSHRRRRGLRDHLARLPTKRRAGNRRAGGKRRIGASPTH